MRPEVALSTAGSSEWKSPTPGTCPICGARSIVPFLAAPDRFHGRTELYHLMRCQSCSYVWLDDPPLPSQMAAHYGPDYDRAVAAAGDDPDRWLGRWKTLQQYKSGGALLDLGCSSGGFLAGLASSSWALHGIEMSAAAAAKAQRKCGAKVYVGDILDAPFPRSSFDAITCFHVFEHLYHPREVLAKVYDWLKPNGIFYVMVPNIDSAGSRIFKSYWYALELPRHLSFFSPKSLRELAQSVGLQEISITTHREVFIEASARYILDERLRRIGIRRTPLAKAARPRLPFRVVRKAFRMTILPVMNGAASLAGDGESIHAIFRKRPSR
jgi:SAM-dependent methyltransferase